MEKFANVFAMDRFSQSVPETAGRVFENFCQLAPALREPSLGATTEDFSHNCGLSVAQI
jgi:hypothetical protein